MIVLKGWDGYSLRLTLYPSFSLSMFKLDDDVYLKYLGSCKGLRIYDYGYDVVVLGGYCDIDYVRELCGVLDDPLNYVYEVEPRFNDVYHYLVTQWRGVGLSTATRDLDYVFISIFLSKRTSYHDRVLQWVNSLFNIIDNPEDLINIDTSNLFKPPQMRELSGVFKEYFYNVRPYVVRGNINDVRYNLLRIKGVGPKITYAYLLHAMRFTEIAPIDTHFNYFIFNVLGLKYGMPKKELCLKYDCSKCNSNCVMRELRSFFGKSLGYLQTVVYVHVKMLCKKGRCYECVLRKYRLCKLKS